MNTSPLVTIAMCVYNGDRFLRLQLDSIINQTYINFELVIVDDCSTDLSRSILTEYEKKDNRIKLHFNSANIGYVKNFEKAIRLAKGQYIALSDHDDIWLPDKIARQVAHIGSHLLIYHDSEYIDDQGNSLHTKMSDLLNLYQGDSPLPFIFRNCVSGHTIMFDRMLIPFLLPFNSNFFHDWWIVFVATNLGSIKLIPDSLVQYRQHVNNTIDILDLRKEKNTNQEKTIFNPLIAEQEWIHHCSTFNGRYKKYITEVHNLLKQSHSFYSRIRLFFKLYKYKWKLLFIDKYRKKDKVKILKKMVFSLNSPSR